MKTVSITALFVFILSGCIMYGDPGYPQGGHAGQTPGQQPDGEAPEKAMGEPLRFLSIAVGESHTCAVTDKGNAQCWGKNENGQLGNGTTDAAKAPMVVMGLQNIRKIRAADSTTCALTQEGKLYCWGELARLTPDGSGSHESHLPVELTELTDIEDLVVGDTHICALQKGGRIHCWGDSENGRIGLAPHQKLKGPFHTLSGVTKPVVLATAGPSTCALQADGKIRCWGESPFGQLGNGRTDPSDFAFKPVTVRKVSGAVAISGVSSGYCALLKNGTITCWGDSDNRKNPATVKELKNVKTIFGNEGKGYAVLEDNSVFHLNGTSEDDFGDGTTVPETEYSVKPTNGFSGVVDFAVGSGHSCAVFSDGQARCWGDNEDGQLGDASGESSETPVDVIQINQRIVKTEKHLQ